MLTARWVASYLLDAKQTWAGIARADQLSGLGDHHPNHVSRSCREFAAATGLKLR